MEQLGRTNCHSFFSKLFWKNLDRLRNSTQMGLFLDWCLKTQGLIWLSNVILSQHIIPMYAVILS